MSQQNEPPIPENVILARFDKDFREAVLAAWKNGHGPRKIAERCGLKESVIRMILYRELGLTRDKKPR